MPEISDRDQKILDGVGVWASYYRSNPHQFAKDYLHLNLKTFQKILLVMMVHNCCTQFVFIASRGLGKTFLSAVFLVIKCILYPGSLTVIASAVRSQSVNVLEKITTELMPNSPELCAEIKRVTMTSTEASILFKNGSYVKVVTAKDSSRGNRATLLIVDEFRMVSKAVIDTVLKKFLTKRRMPPYNALTEEERKQEYDKEKSALFLLSSAWFVDHWSYQKCVEICKNMLSGRRSFICGLPYQISIKEGLLDPELLEDEMLEPTFTESSFSMEYECLWYGANDGAFFDYKSISKTRRIKTPMYPGRIADKLGNHPSIRIPVKENHEVRILSADIALMESKKNDNDATSIFINRMMPSKAGRYTHNFVYSENHEGLRTEEQALIIRKLFDEFDCDFMVLDCQGIGLGVYDALAADITDPETGEIYPALSCCNNQEMANRCTVQGADKVIYCIKASAQFNSDAAFLLREGFKNGRIRLLENEFDGEEALSGIKGYNKLSQSEQVAFKLPYIDTTLLIDELTKLGHEEFNGKVKLRERRGMRKDRYSSISYNYYIALQIENKIRKKRGAEFREDDFIIKAPSAKILGRRGSYSGRKKNHKGWQG